MRGTVVPLLRRAWRLGWVLVLACGLAMDGPGTGARAAGPALLDVIYVGGSNGVVTAVDGNSGAVLWRTGVGGSVDGRLLVAGTRLYATTWSGLTVLDSVSGGRLWSFQPDSGCGAPALPYLGGVRLAGGMVYLPCPGGALDALDAATGALIWSFTDGGAVTTPPAVAGGVAYLAAGDGNVYALDTRTGDPLWRTHTGGGSSAPVLVDGTLYAGSNDGSLDALDARDGHLLWRFATGGAVLSAPVVSGGLLYVGSDDQNVYALDAHTGAQVWSFPTGGKVRSTPTLAGGVLYVGSDDQNVYALDAARGTPLWTFPTGGAVEASPVVAGATVYVCSSDQTLYALAARNAAQLWAIRVGGAVFASPAVDRQTRRLRLALQRQRRHTAADVTLPAGGDAPYFRQTGHTMGQPFLSFWQRYGGLSTFGYPITEAFTENGHQVQYTERFRLEVINGAVTTGPLGRILSLSRPFPPLPASPSTATLMYFPATRHSLSGAFLAYWQANHGALLLGAPISEVTQERDGDPTGRLHPTQWFERGRLEYRAAPATGASVVVPGALGRELLTSRGWLP